MSTFRTNFEFYYDEDTMNIPETVMESEKISQEAKNVYLYIIYLITENVEHILEAMKEIPEVAPHLEKGLAELKAIGLVVKDDASSSEAYIVTKEFTV